eukprot:8476144-Prorocentrum_lima.AAC.1
MNANPERVSCPPLPIETAVRIQLGGSNGECKVSIGVEDLLRPLNVTVEQFGSTWKKLAVEEKMT